MKLADLPNGAVGVAGVPVVFTPYCRAGVVYVFDDAIITRSANDEIIEVKRIRTRFPRLEVGPMSYESRLTDDGVEFRVSARPKIVWPPAS